MKINQAGRRQNSGVNNQAPTTNHAATGSISTFEGVVRTLKRSSGNAFAAPSQPSIPVPKSVSPSKEDPFMDASYVSNDFPSVDALSETSTAANSDAALAPFSGVPNANTSSDKSFNNLNSIDTTFQNKDSQKNKPVKREWWNTGKKLKDFRKYLDAKFPNEDFQKSKSKNRECMDTKEMLEDFRKQVPEPSENSVDTSVSTNDGVDQVKDRDSNSTSYHNLTAVASNADFYDRKESPVKSKGKIFRFLRWLVPKGSSSPRNADATAKDKKTWNGYHFHAGVVRSAKTGRKIFRM